MRIAISGHRGLSPDTVELVDAAIRQHLATQPRPFVGISCLADGADQIFARAVLDAGGQLDVVVPAVEYRDGLPAEAHADYDLLLGCAAQVVKLGHKESTSEAHMYASRVMLERADRLVAVWDGQPARGYGGTADVVHLAQDLGLDVTIIWPNGASR